MIWLKSLQTWPVLSIHKFTSLPKPRNNKTAKNKHKPLPNTEVTGCHGESCHFTILLLFHLLRTWPGSVAMACVPSSCCPAQHEDPRGSVLTPDKTESVAPAVRQGESLWLSTATELRVREGRPLFEKMLVWPGLPCGSNLLSCLPSYVLLSWFLPFLKGSGCYLFYDKSKISSISKWKYREVNTDHSEFHHPKKNRCQISLPPNMVFILTSH